MSDAAIAERIKPVGQLNTGAPFTPAAPASAPAESAVAESAPAEAAPAASAPVAAAPAAGPRSGQEVYKSACFVCHDMGIAGAPKLGDTAAWAPRIAQGMASLQQHAIDGFQGATGVMPARGTCAACSDDELKAAVEYMVNSSK
jgi:cytochrome c5